MGPENEVGSSGVKYNRKVPLNDETEIQKDQFVWKSNLFIYMILQSPLHIVRQGNYCKLINEHQDTAIHLHLPPWFDSRYGLSQYSAAKNKRYIAISLLTKQLLPIQFDMSEIFRKKYIFRISTHSNKRYFFFRHVSCRSCSNRLATCSLFSFNYTSKVFISLNVFVK